MASTPNIQETRRLIRALVSEMIESRDGLGNNIIKNGGLLLIKGPEINGSRRLYVTQVKDILILDRKKKDDTSAAPAKMALLTHNINRVVLDGNQLRSVYVDWKSEEGQAVKLGLSGSKVGGVVLNNNKTPLHWKTLTYNNVPTMLSGLRWEILGISGIDLSLS